jgi:hypothetical protein
VAAFTPMILGASIFGNFSGSELTKNVPIIESGTMISIDMALQTAYRSLSPLFAGIIFNYFGYKVFASIGVICTLSAFILSKFKYEKSQNQNIEKEK